jgi:hypothetical protein
VKKFVWPTVGSALTLCVLGLLLYRIGYKDGHAALRPVPGQPTGVNGSLPTRGDVEAVTLGKSVEDIEQEYGPALGRKVGEPALIYRWYGLGPKDGQPCNRIALDLRDGVVVNVTLWFQTE